MTSRDLDYFKKQLLQKRTELIDVVHKAESYGREMDAEAEAMDMADRASKSYTKEFMFSFSNLERQLIILVEEALERIQDGSYGECTHCGETLGRRRLEAVPWALLCVHCQELKESGRLS
jgi:DnaK suppressor protein